MVSERRRIIFKLFCFVLGRVCFFLLPLLFIFEYSDYDDW